MSLAAFVLTELTAELALFAAAGFFLFAIDDLAVDLIYFIRSAWRTGRLLALPANVGNGVAGANASGLDGGADPCLG